MVSYGTNPDYKSEADFRDDDPQHLLSRYLAAKGSEADAEEGVWHIRCPSIAIPGRVLGCISSLDRRTEVGDYLGVQGKKQKWGNGKFHGRLRLSCGVRPTCFWGWPQKCPKILSRPSVCW
jgi:hypothetical protein